MTVKSALRDWKNDKNSGHVFDLHLYDGSAEISLSCFNAEAYDAVKVRFQLRTLDQRFNVQHLL